MDKNWELMEKYKTIIDFPNVDGIMKVIYSVVTAIPPFFPIMLFVFWLGGAAISYFAVLQITGRKRFWHCLTAMSFSCFLLSLLLAAMNTTTIKILDGYWVGFYILMTLVSWWLLSNYK